MKKIFTLLLGFLLVSTLFANPVDQQTALLVAGNYFQAQTKKSAKLTLVYQCLSQRHSINKNTEIAEQVYYYVFNSDNGFIIVAGDDAVYPILGYSSTSTFQVDKQADNFKKWLESYKQQINYVVANKIQATAQIEAEWNAILKNKQISKNTKAVNALMTTTWSQSPYVNALCPYDADAGQDNGYHCVTGCPATAMAQIMKYWNFPKQGTGFHQYSHDTYGNLSANFGATTYNWAEMPNDVNSANSAVATLMYHCGVAVEMGYGPTSSGSYVIIDYSPTPEQSSEYAYKTYFGYNPATIKGLMRENYTDAAWIQMLKTDLDNGRPIQYAGFGQGGHTFVCDGYDNNNYFHFNWGWGGYADGFFLINALNPGSGGTGSGAGTYNDGQQAVFGIQPPQGTVSNTLKLNATLTVSPNPITFGQAFTVHTDIVNAGTATFEGSFAAAIFDADDNFLDFVQQYPDMSLNVGYHYTNGIDFVSQGMLAALPGEYHISVFYKPTAGNWQIIDDGQFSNSVQLDIQYINDVAIYKDIVVSTTEITQGKPFQITTAFANIGTAPFAGKVAMSLFDIETGDFIQDIDVIDVTNITNGYFMDFTFSSTGINIEPGTYLLAGFHLKTGGEWELSGSQYKTNPVKVIVKAADLLPDSYENNNSEAYAYTLPISFLGDNATYYTNGSNNHVGEDLDYYKIELPKDYHYTLDVRVHDSYNTDDGNTYTNDVTWAYLHDGIWSESFDDVMPNFIEVPNGGTLIFGVAPYFVGTTGTYLLDIAISKQVTALETINNDEVNFVVYPNPSSDFFYVKSNSNYLIQSIDILDISGKLIVSEKLNTMSNELKFSTQMLQSGIYFIDIKGQNFSKREKLMVK